VRHGLKIGCQMLQLNTFFGHRVENENYRHRENCRGTDMATTLELSVTLPSHHSASYPMVGGAVLSNATWRISGSALGAGNAGVGVWVTGWACDLTDDESRYVATVDYTLANAITRSSSSVVFPFTSVPPGRSLCASSALNSVSRRDLTTQGRRL
jgi:hypothetical protein